VLLDKNPTVFRQELAPQIHLISDDTHHKIHALLTDHQKELEKAMLQREHHGEENRPAPDYSWALRDTGRRPADSIPFEVDADLPMESFTRG
jgi:hypothetical protein